MSASQMGVIAKTAEKENPSLCGAKSCIKGTVNVKAITGSARSALEEHKGAAGGTRLLCMAPFLWNINT